MQTSCNPKEAHKADALFALFFFFLRSIIIFNQVYMCGYMHMSTGALRGQRLPILWNWSWIWLQAIQMGAGN